MKRIIVIFFYIIGFRRHFHITVYMPYVKYNQVLLRKIQQKITGDKYEANNWRLIPQEEHINHALIHYYAAMVGDTQDEHIQHCMCRLMMAFATEKSENFDYSRYIKG